MKLRLPEIANASRALPGKKLLTDDKYSNENFTLYWNRYYTAMECIPFDPVSMRRHAREQRESVTKSQIFDWRIIMRCNIRLWINGAWILTLLFVVLNGNAQEFRAVLTGQVTDPSAAVIRNATITAVNVDSGTTYTAKTTDKGVYYVPYVLPGNYTVTAKADGFKTTVQDKVVLLASQTFNQNFKLEVGSVAQQVVVSTAPAQLETSTGSGGTVIDTRELQNVPLNG
jgi:hypothetical protein